MRCLHSQDVYFLFFFEKEMYGQGDNLLQMYFFLKYNELSSELGIPGGKKCRAETCETQKGDTFIVI